MSETVGKDRVDKNKNVLLLCLEFDVEVNFSSLVEWIKMASIWWSVERTSSVSSHCIRHSSWNQCRSSFFRWFPFHWNGGKLANLFQFPSNTFKMKISFCFPWEFSLVGIFRRKRENDSSSNSLRFPSVGELFIDFDKSLDELGHRENSSSISNCLESLFNAFRRFDHHSFIVDFSTF